MIFIGTDHRGFELKEKLKVWLHKHGHKVIDVGAATYNPGDDYIDFAIAVSQAVSKQGNQQSVINNQQFGILICGSGVGVNIAANKIQGIRCGLGLSKEQVVAARRHDDINVLALAADYVSSDQAKEMVKALLDTPFSGEERHRDRIEKIKTLEHLDASAF